MNASPRTATLLSFFLVLGFAACGPHELVQPVAGAVGDVPTLGATEPKIVVSLFTDYQCPNCRRAGDVAQRLVDRWPEDVQVRFHHMPLEFHPLALLAAQAAQAAHRQGRFMCMHTSLTKTRKAWTDLDDQAFDAFLRDVLAPRCGLDLASFQRDLADLALTEVIVMARERARDIGVPGTPSVYVNGLEADAWPRPGESSARRLNSLVRRELADIAAGGRGLGRCAASADWQCRLFDRVASNTGDEARARLLLD